ncbi:hypothetical protein QM042_01760 [Escherichia coli]|uniref:hypothetical protein n=1 Tax=Escherichia coli TaxID=562 RepID=UPI0039870633
MTKIIVVRASNSALGKFIVVQQIAVCLKVKKKKKVHIADPVIRRKQHDQLV